MDFTYSRSCHVTLASQHAGRAFVQPRVNNDNQRHVVAGWKEKSGVGVHFVP